MVCHAHHHVVAPKMSAISRVASNTGLLLESDSMISNVRIRFDEIAQFEITIFSSYCVFASYALATVFVANHQQGKSFAKISFAFTALFSKMTHFPAVRMSSIQCLTSISQRPLVFEAQFCKVSLTHTKRRTCPWHRGTSVGKPWTRFGRIVSFYLLQGLSTSILHGSQCESSLNWRILSFCAWTKKLSRYL